MRIKLNPPSAINTAKKLAALELMNQIGNAFYDGVADSCYGSDLTKAQCAEVERQVRVIMAPFYDRLYRIVYGSKA